MRTSLFLGVLWEENKFCIFLLSVEHSETKWGIFVLYEVIITEFLKQATQEMLYQQTIAMLCDFLYLRCQLLVWIVFAGDLVIIL